MTRQAHPDGTTAAPSANDRLEVSVEAAAIRIARFEATGSITVARAGDSEAEPTLTAGRLCLPSRYVSRDRHCTIEALNGARVRVIDHDSTNGTRLDGRAVTGEAIVPAPCRIQLHPFELLVSRGDPTAGTAPLRPDSGAQPDLRIDAESDAVLTPSGAVVNGLTPLQRLIVRALIRRYPDWLSSAELATITGTVGHSDQSVYSQIYLIRRRLEEAQPGGAELLISQRGRGYAVTPRPS